MTPDCVRPFGLDLSLTGTGVAPPQGSPFTIKTKADIDDPLAIFKRYRFICREILEAVRNTHATHVIVEDPSLHSKGHQLDTFGLAQIVRYVLFERGVPFVGVTPATLKKFATGKGNSHKDEMISAAIQRFGYTGASNDEADAYLLRMMAEASLGRVDTLLTKDRRLQVLKIDWPWDVVIEP